MKRFVEISVKALNGTVYSVAQTLSIAIADIIEATKDGNDTLLEIDGYGFDLSRYTIDADVDTLLALLPSNEFVKVTVKKKDALDDYTVATRPVKLLAVRNITKFIASGADTVITYNRSGLTTTQYLVDETYANIKTALASAIAADVIREYTAAAGVTIDGVLLKDGIANQSYINALVAAGADQATALQLTSATINRVATTAASTGVKLLAGAAAGASGNTGRMVVVANDGASSLSVYPEVGGIINALAANAAFAVAAGKRAIFFNDGAGHWTAFLSA